MATSRRRGPTLELKAYAGVDPATGKKEYLYDRVPAAWAEEGSGHKRELDRVIKALDARAHAKAESRRAWRLDPSGERPRKKPTRVKAKTVEEAVEAWWKHHGSKLDGAPKVRGLIDGIIIPNLGPILVALTAGTPPDDDDDRDDDLVYLSERWAAIAAGDRKLRPGADGHQPKDKDGKPIVPGPLEPATIHRCHGIVGAALRRAGHPIVDPGLPAVPAGLDTTPLAEEMVAFLPHLAQPGQTGGYTTTRRVRGSDRQITYTVKARTRPPTAMDLMLEAFALLVGSGPRPVEAAAITRADLSADYGVLSLSARGVVMAKDDDGPERWVIVTGETAKRRRRVVTLRDDPRTVGALRRWLAFQDEYALRRGKRLSGRALVFSLDHEGREPISPKVMSRAFERAVARARAAGCELPDGFHLYDMRHFGITNILRLGKGRNVAAVAERFGTSTRMIQERYEHVIPKDDAHLSEILGSVWGGPDPVDGVVVNLHPTRP